MESADEPPMDLQEEEDGFSNLRPVRLLREIWKEFTFGVGAVPKSSARDVLVRF